MNKVILGIGITLVILVIALFPTSVIVQYQRLENYQESYNDRESYQTQVPYQETEYYTEKEPYTYTKNVDTSVPYNTEVPYQGTILRAENVYTWYPPTMTARFTILNDEDVVGTYRVTAIFSPIVSVGDIIGASSELITGVPGIGIIGKALESGETRLSGRADIPPKSTGIIDIPVGILNKVKGGNYELIPPLKTVTQYRTSPETKEFTDYRDIQKSREVTKYRTETQYRDIIKQRPAQRYVTDNMQKTVFMYQRILGWY